MRFGVAALLAVLLTAFLAHSCSPIAATLS